MVIIYVLYLYQVSNKATKKLKNKTMTNSISKPAKNKMYSYNSRFSNIEDAKQKAKELNGEKHAYYTKITENGASYFDVRTEN
jgi:hypothetical protein